SALEKDGEPEPAREAGDREPCEPDHAEVAPALPRGRSLRGSEREEGGHEHHEKREEGDEVRQDEPRGGEDEDDRRSSSWVGPCPQGAGRDEREEQEGVRLPERSPVVEDRQAPGSERQPSGRDERAAPAGSEQARRGEHRKGAERMSGQDLALPHADRRKTG